MRYLTILAAAAGLAVTGCGGRAPTPEPGPPEEVSSEGLAEAVTAGLPPGAFDSVAVRPLSNTLSDEPLWAVHSCGMLNWDMDPRVDHFLAVWTRVDSEWVEMDRLAFDEEYYSPDFLEPDGVSQIGMTSDFVWMMVEGYVGAHGGTCDLVTFDGGKLESRFSSSFSTPGFAHVENLPADSLPDLVLDFSDPYVFCYASSVRKADVRVARWDALDLEMIVMELQRLPRTAPDELVAGVDRAVDLANAGLWKQAMEAIDLLYPADGSLSERDRWTLDWDYVLISQNAGRAESLAGGTYPLLENVFYGDYDAALDIMRQYGPADVFSGSSPLIVGTQAEDWEAELSDQLVRCAESAVAVEPGMASAWFIFGWGAWLADSTSTAAVEYLTEASTLAPGDPFIASCLEYLVAR
jgi:hypothetical protein